jgi:hypothetical protein
VGGSGSCLPVRIRFFFFFGFGCWFFFFLSNYVWAWNWVMMVVVFIATGNYPQRETLRRGRSLLAREEDVHESGLALFKRGTLRRKRPQSSNALPPPPSVPDSPRKGCLGDIPGPKGPWMAYCYILTCYIPPFLLRTCGTCTYAFTPSSPHAFLVVAVVFCRYSQSRTTTCMAGKDGSRQHHPVAHGWSRVSHVRIH